MRLGDELLYRYIRSFGFGERTEIDLPSEEPGLVTPLPRWSGISVGSVSMGQEVGVTALQILRAVTAIAARSREARRKTRLLRKQGKPPPPRT